MSSTRQTILASRPAAMVLALTLVAGLSAPFLMLSRAHAAGDPPPVLPCAEVNNNGCTELSPTPPEDTASVPPNIVLMLDDSGSMAWDFMPDWEYLADNSLNGVRDAAGPAVGDVPAPGDVGVNTLYYNPYQTYVPPPKADSTAAAPDLYLNSPGITNAYKNGFLDTSPVNLTTYNGNPNDQNDAGATTTFRYWENLVTSSGSTTYPAVQGCTGAGYHLVGGTCVYTQPAPVRRTTHYHCNVGDTYAGGGECRHNNPEGPPNYYPATETYSCPAGTTPNGVMCDYPATNSNKAPVWQCPSGGSIIAGSSPPICKKTTTGHEKVFTFVKGNPGGPYTQYYVAAGSGCGDLTNATEQSHCVNEGDTTGKFPDGTISGPAGVPVGQNVANWFSYYHTRILMAKSGLMTAFSNLGPNYRFGFASINANGKANIPGTPAPYTFDDAGCGGNCGDSNNPLAVVQPFGDGSPGTQKALFWNWIANESANNGTPLRKALQAVGQYYQTSQPWTTMPGDPGWQTGSTTQFTCRASYTILTTDGFWNGDPPSGIGYAAGVDGPVNTVPTGDITRYTAQPPFSGGGVGGTEPSLADVATYYWETDLQPGLANEVAPSTADPASWQHMTTFTVGLGFTPTGITPAPTPPATTIVPQIFAWAQSIYKPVPAAIPGWTSSSWPTPSSNSVNNIADLAHAAVNGHGDFFNVTKPAELAAAFGKALADIAARTITPTPAAVNASVLSLGALSFSTGYSTKDWSGAFEAVTLKTDGTVDQYLWLDGSDPNHPSLVSELDSAYHSTSSYVNRNVYTDAYKVAGGVGTFSAFRLTDTASLDTTETAGLETPALPTPPSNDTLAHRIDYLLGDSTYEDGTTYRTRSSILGAILRSQPVYVAGATGNYYDSWPATPGSPPTPAPENAVGAQTFDAFVTQQSTQPGMVYVGANDGMLHAFNAPVPTCPGSVDVDGNCSVAYTSPAGAGTEAWAFVPRAVYANLGNLTNAANFQFRPTVDATPVTRDVFFSGNWHTILAGGVGLGGRGVYALDVTNPASFETPITTYPASGVLWEFDSDMPTTGCVASYGTCKGTDLGYTVSQPNIGRLHNGKWAVLVPNGYFPDCTTPDFPTADTDSCNAIAAQAPKDASNGNAPYSALFVLDAQTGSVIAELKTPTTIPGVISFGLATPVMGDYNNDQVDDVAFAGDVEGNLWRFDLSDPQPANWTVTLVYQAPTQGAQPITTMPRLFPDPVTNRFMVVFGTGKFLGLGDNGNVTQQALIGVRDVVGTTYTQNDLTQQYLHETIAPPFLPDGTTPNPNAGASLRCVTGSSADDCSASATPVNPVPTTSGGWFINLYTTTSDGTQNDAGERVVVNPGAIFASNTVVFETLITGSQSSDACNPSTQGSILALNATTGGPAGVSSLGGWPIAGGRISDARTSGGLPVVSALGGGQAYLPGSTLAPAGKNPISIDAPIWRRRSWQEINQNQ